jgi:glycosyltransferase involved in cell wall biosynthesis
MVADIEGKLRSLPNVAWRGFLPHEQLQEVYRRTAILLCTSESEGFPNVFLEAWGHGVPTLSTVDPDGLIAAHALGEVAPTYEGLRRALARVDADRPEWRERGRRAAVYVRANHAPAASAAALEGVLRGLTSSSATRSLVR